MDALLSMKKVGREPSLFNENRKGFSNLWLSPLSKNTVPTWTENLEQDKAYLLQILEP